MNWFGSTKTLDVHICGCARSSATTPRAALHPHRPRCRVPLRAAGRGEMSLRARLLAALAYALLLVIVALEVPLALTTSRPRRAEVARERLHRRAGRRRQRRRAPRPARRAGVDRRRGPASDLGGRVLILDADGAPLADSAVPTGPTTPTSTGPRCASALAGDSVQGSATPHARRGPPVHGGTGARQGADRGAVRLTQSVGGVNSDRPPRPPGAGGRRRRRAGDGPGRRLDAGGHAVPAAAEAGRRRPAASPTAISRPGRRSRVPRNNARWPAHSTT